MSVNLTRAERERFDYWDFPGGGHSDLIAAVERTVADRLGEVSRRIEAARDAVPQPETHVSPKRAAFSKALRILREAGR